MTSIVSPGLSLPFIGVAVLAMLAFKAMARDASWFAAVKRVVLFIVAPLNGLVYLPFLPEPLKIVLLTGSTRVKERREALDAIASGGWDSERDRVLGGCHQFSHVGDERFQSFA